MKCINCNHDSKYKEREGGRCPKCGHAFAFEPQSGDKMTDMAFQRAMERVSASGKVRWAIDHLYHELRRPKRTRIAWWMFGGLSLVLLFGAGSLLAAGIPKIAAPLGGAGVFTGILALGIGAARDLSREDFGKLWKRWTEVHGTPSSLVVPASRRQAPDPHLEAELSAYSFDRAVICDRRAIVDVLLANQFHFENNCAVLGFDGYPEGIFPVVMKMLRQNPRLNVFVIHDASPEGCRLARTLRSSPAWFAGIGRVVDVGLRPAHARFFPKMAIRYDTPITVAPSEDISQEEAAWLSRERLELAVVRPEQLIKRLYRAITEVESQGWEQERSGGVDDTVVYFGVDAETSDGGGDSFG